MESENAKESENEFSYWFNRIFGRSSRTNANNQTTYSKMIEDIRKIIVSN